MHQDHSEFKNSINADVNTLQTLKEVGF